MKIFHEAIIIFCKNINEKDILLRLLTKDSGVLSTIYKKNKKDNYAECGNLVNATIFQRENTLGKCKIEPVKLFCGNAIFLSPSCLSFLSNGICVVDEICKISQNINQSELFFYAHNFLQNITNTKNNEKHISIFLFFVIKFLSTMGYGLQIQKCVASGEENEDELIYVSPKSLCGVSKKAAIGYEELMLRLPPFLLNFNKNFTTEDLKNCIRIINKFITKNELEQKFEFLTIYLQNLSFYR